MQACPALAVSAVAFVVECVACMAVAVAASVGAVAIHVEDTVPLAAVSRMKISTRTILARISRQEQEEGTARDTMQDIRGQGPAATPVAGIVWGHTR